MSSESNSKLPRLDHPPLGKPTRATYDGPEATDLFDQEVQVIWKEIDGPAFTVPAKYSPHPDAKKYPNHLLDTAVPTEDGKKIKLTYVVWAEPQVSAKGTGEGLLDTVTRQRVKAETAPPSLSALRIDVDQRDLGNGDAVLSTVDEPEVFPASEFQVSRPDRVPPKYQDSVPLQTEAETTEGQAEMPTLAPGELERSSRQTTKFRKRDSVTKRDLTPLPVTITDYKLGGIQAGGAEHGGVLAIEGTLSDDPSNLPIEQGFLILDSKLETLGSGLHERETVRLWDVNDAELQLTNAGSGFEEAPIVVFTPIEGGSGSGAAGTPVLSTVPTPENGEEGGTFDLDYASFGDANGVFNFLAARYNGGIWRNPATAGTIDISAQADPGHPVTDGLLSRLVDRNFDTPVTIIPVSSGGGHAINFGLGTGRTLKPTHITLRAAQDSRNIARHTHLRVQGTNDNGVSWVDLGALVPIPRIAGDWTIGNLPNSVGYTAFRVFGTDNHVEGYPNLWPALVLGEVEFYGELTIVPGVPLEYSNDGDDHGVLNYLGALGNGGVWRNPSANDDVDITSSLSLSSGTVDDLANRESSDVVQTGANGSFTIDLKAGRRLVCNKISVRHRSGASSPLKFKLQGKVENADPFVDLVTVDRSAEVAESWFSKDVPGASAYRQFRLLSSQTNFALGEVELYGALTFPPDTVPDPTYSIASVTITNAGEDYAEPPNVNFDGDGTGATGVAILDGQGHVTRVEMTNRGHGYTSATVSFHALGELGSGAAATSIINGAVTAIDVDVPGSAYETAPDVVVDGGPGSAGSGAEAHAHLEFPIDDITVGTQGSGYASAPTVNFTPPSTAAAHSVLSKAVDSIEVADGGTGYSSPPAVGIDAPTGINGVQATAHAVMGAGGGANAFALSLDGTDDYVSFVGQLLDPNDSTWTFEANVKLDINANNVVLGADNGTGDYWMIFCGSSVGLAFQYDKGGGAVVLGAPSLIIPTGGWHHLAVTKNGNNYKLYVDTVLVNTHSHATGGGLTTSGVVTLGGLVPSFGLYLDGKIDDVRIWSTERSQPQIAANYNAGLTGGEAGLVHYFPADAGSGTSLVDGAGSEDGTLVNGTAWTSDAPTFGGVPTDSVASIVIDNPGFGYLTIPNVTLTGDGTDADADATLAATGAVDHIVVDNPGYFTSAPAVGFSSGSAAATATLETAGRIKNITIGDGGSNYQGAPGVTFDTHGGPGSGADATAHISGPVSGFVVTDGGTGYDEAPDVEVQGSATATATVVDGEVTALVLGSGGSGYSTPPAVVLHPIGGPEAVATLGFGIDHITVDNQGSGYLNPPPVLIEGDGRSASAYSVLGRGVLRVEVIDSGDNYGPTAHVGLNSNTGTGATASLVRSFGLASVTVDDDGSGYTSDPVVSAPSPDGSDYDAVLQALRGLPLQRINILNGGSGYSTPPTVVIPAPFGAGTLAVGDSVLGFGVASIAMDSMGSGYTSTPRVEIRSTDGAGNGATAVAELLGRTVASIIVDNGGSGYVTPPTIVVGDGTGATATAVLTGDVITSITVDTPGGGYTAAPVIYTGNDGGGTGAHAVAVLSAGQDMRIVVTSPGAGYESEPDVIITLGGGSGAAASSTLASTGTVKRVELSNNGTNYTSDVVVTFTGDGTASATGVRDVNAAGGIASISVLSSGSGYIASSIDCVITGGGGSGAEAHATKKTLGKIKSVTITAQGSGYEAPPIVGVGEDSEDDIGSGVVLRAIMTVAGKVKSVVLTSAGGGFTEAPGISFPDNNGSGALATAVLSDEGSIKTLTLTEPGGPFTTAPLVSFVPTGDAPIATALYILPRYYPTLRDELVDPTEDLIIQVTKDIVEPETPLPDGYAEKQALNRYRSIQIVSKIDLDRLPRVKSWLTTQHVSLPDQLTGVVPVWSTRVAHSSSVNGVQTRGSAAATAEVSGSILVLKKGGFRGAALARVERTFFKGVPPDDSIPDVTIIRPSTGTAFIRGGSNSETQEGDVQNLLNVDGTPAQVGDVIGFNAEGQPIIFTGYNTAGGGASNSSALSSTLQIVDISDVLTPGLISSAFNFIGQDSAPNVGSGYGVNVHAEIEGQFGVNMPASCPASIPEGMAILQEVAVEKRRFDIYVRYIIFVYAPGDCRPIGQYGPGPS